jgi:HK97 family phage portal protein
MLEKVRAFLFPGFEQRAILPAISSENRDNFERNSLTVSTYNDWLDRLGTNYVLGLTAAWACVNLLAGTIASLPLMVYRTGPGGVRTPARDHPLYRVLHDSPNADQTALDFWEFVCASLELRGNSYAEIERGVSGQVIGLYPIRPEAVRVSRNTAGRLQYKWNEAGQEVTRDQDEVFHIRGFGGNPLGGLSTLAACSGTFGANATLEGAAANVFANGVRPSGILSTDKTMTPEQRTVAEGLLQQKFVGAVNAGRPMLLDNGVKWEQLTINPEDAQMLESRRFGVEEICRIFGVPPHMVGHTENSTSWGTGIEQQTLGFQKFTLRRRMKRIEQAIGKQLMTPADRASGIIAEFNLEGLLRGDSEGRAKVNEINLRNKVLTINEVRAQDNLPPVSWGDRPWGQMQDLQLNELGEVPAKPVAS